MSFQAEAVVDLDAIAANVAALARHTDAAVLPAVKAEAYGHGLVPAARACLDGGATGLGVATVDEAMALRRNGITAPVLAWLLVPGLALETAIDADVDLAAASLPLLDEIAAAAGSRPARVHLKVDTGMGRGGVAQDEWPRFAERAAKHVAAGKITLAGAFSHLARADEPEAVTTAVQNAAFGEFCDILGSLDVTPEWTHLANSAGLLAHPDTHHNLVRPGIAVYGYPPVPTDVVLRPAMTVRARLSAVKTLPAGHGVGYGHTHITDHPTQVAIAPLGYADGVPRAVSNLAQVMVKDRRCRVIGRVSMDQVVLEVDGLGAKAGDVAVFFGPGGITADDWAGWNDTIPYEILTSVGPRVARRYLEAGSERR